MRPNISSLLIKILQPIISFSIVFEILYHLRISILILFAKTCIKVKVPKWWCQIREVLGKRGGKGICACPFKNVKICCTFTSKFVPTLLSEHCWTLKERRSHSTNSRMTTFVKLRELSLNEFCLNGKVWIKGREENAR